MKKHIWKKISEKKVKCSKCGKEQWISKLTLKQRKTLEAPPELEVEAVDLLMWVGRSYYSVDSFINESRRMGVCKRVPMLPRGTVKGKSRVFLAHPDAIKRIGGKTFPGVFAYFTVQGISYVVKPGVDIPEALKERGVEKWEYVEGGFGFSDERGCGSLAIGGTYLLSEEDMEKCRDLANSTTLSGRFNIIDPAVYLSIGRFRGYKHVIGDNILARKPEGTWYEEAHEAYLRNKRAMSRWKRAKRKLREKEQK